MAVNMIANLNRSARPVALVCLLLSASLAHADVVAPNANESVEAGSNNRFPLLVEGGMRYQQVYTASEFSSFSPGGELITGIAFRPDSGSGAAFGPVTVNDLTISLSTTAAVPDLLSSTFADNLGADNTQVFSGGATISSLDSPGPGNTRAFDVQINFSTPFLYNPANGNLLLDILNGDSADNDISVYFDGTNPFGDSVGRAWGSEGEPSDTTGSRDSLGLVTLFKTQPVPEPSTFLALSVAGTMSLGRCSRWLR